MKQLVTVFMSIWLALPLLAQQMPGGMAAPAPEPLPHPEIPAPPALPHEVSPLLVVSALFGIALVTAALVMLLFGRKGAGAAAPKRPIKDALRALKDLRNKADVLPPTEVGHQVSEIMRRFYEGRYGIPAPYRTSQELFPQVDITSEPIRRRVWRERYEPLAAIYDALSYAPVPATTVEAVKLIDTSMEKLEEERLNEDAIAS